MGELQFWQVFMDLCGRGLLTLLLVDITLLLILEITKYGNFKNSRDRSKVSSSDSLWEDTTSSGSAEHSGVEILEAHTKRISARFNPFKARYVTTGEGILITPTNEHNGSNGANIHTEQSSKRELRHNKNKLSTPTDSAESLAHPLGV